MRRALLLACLLAGCSTVPAGPTTVRRIKASLDAVRAIDTHDHPVISPVWKIYKRAIERCGAVATLLEWDDKIPTFDEVHREALKAAKYLPNAKIRAAA